MPRAKLSNVSLKQLVAELKKRQARLTDLLVQREAITKEIEALEALGFVPAVGQAPAKRRGRPPGKRGPQPKAVRATGRTLATYVKETLAGATKGLSVIEIEKRILASAYPTKAKRLYKQVVAVLGKGGFKKVARGVYVLKGATAAVKAAVASAAKAPAARAKAAPKAKGGRKRGHFTLTAEQLILDLAKGKGATTVEINKAWKDAGRGGKADVDLSGLVKAGKLNRKKEDRGSRFTATPAPF